MFYAQLVQNVGFLVSLVVVHGQTIRRWSKNTFTSQSLSGFLFGCVAVIGMMAPVHFVSGVIFDGHPVVLSVAGLFGGPVTGATAAIMSAAYRLWLGGSGTFTGVSVSLVSASLGVAFYYLRHCLDVRAELGRYQLENYPGLISPFLDHVDVVALASIRIDCSTGLCTRLFSFLTNLFALRYQRYVPRGAGANLKHCRLCLVSSDTEKFVPIGWSSLYDATSA